MIGSRVKVQFEGTARLKAAVKKHRRFKAKAFIRGLKKAGAFLMGKSQEVVPVDTGLLHDSARSVTRGRGWASSQEVSYNTPYAIYVHEDLSMTHAPGKTAKYLERPARQHRREMAQIVADEMRKG